MCGTGSFALLSVIEIFDELMYLNDDVVSLIYVCYYRTVKNLNATLNERKLLQEIKSSTGATEKM